MLNTYVSNRLSPDQIRQRLVLLPAGWKVTKAHLVRQYQISGFSQGVSLLGRFAEEADKMDHHPDVCLQNYNELTVSLTTHSAGGLTDKDFELASRLQKIVDENEQ